MIIFSYLKNEFDKELENYKNKIYMDVIQHVLKITSGLYYKKKEEEKNRKEII